MLDHVAELVRIGTHPAILAIARLDDKDISFEQYLTEPSKEARQSTAGMTAGEYVDSVWSGGTDLGVTFFVEDDGAPASQPDNYGIDIDPAVTPEGWEMAFDEQWRCQDFPAEPSSALLMVVGCWSRRPASKYVAQLRAAICIPPAHHKDDQRSEGWHRPARRASLAALTPVRL